MRGSSRRKTTTPSRSCLLALALVASACAGPEQPLLDRFFAASRLRDRTQLQAIATVVFEPRERGIVTKFTVVRVDASGGRRVVTIHAPVELPDGRTVQKTFAVTLTLDNEQRWIVTAVDDL
ncbi:MAG TPA: hypothetical protein VIW45_06215 [Vicinamibacterales bacterium]